MGLGLSSDGENEDQPSRKHVVSQISRTLSADEWQGAEAAEHFREVAGTIAENSSDAGR